MKVMESLETVDTKNQYEIIPKVIDIIIEKTDPEKVVLFGSCARRCITENSDIDLCLVLKGKINKREKIKIRVLLLEELLQITEYEIDLFICDQEEWNINYANQGTFIGKIYSEGRIVYGGQ